MSLFKWDPGKQCWLHTHTYYFKWKRNNWSLTCCLRIVISILFLKLHDIDITIIFCFGKMSDHTQNIGDYSKTNANIKILRQDLDAVWIHFNLNWTKLCWHNPSKPGSHFNAKSLTIFINFKIFNIIFIQLIVLFELLFKVAGQWKNITANLNTATLFTFLVIAFYRQNEKCKWKFANWVNSTL
jgi:hypothetical protein